MHIFKIYSKKTPYKLWYSNFPNLNYMRIQGCPTYVKIVKPDKLDVKLEKG